MANSFLYIEDYDNSREEGLRAFRENKITNIIAPISNPQCKVEVESGEFKGAIIDFKLSYWVGKNNETAIQLGDKECYNGIEIAEFLFSKHKDIHIGLYSSKEDDLNLKLKGSAIRNKIEVVSQKNVSKKNINQFLPDFFKQFHNLEIIVKPLHNPVNMPPEIQNYYAKKLLNIRNRGIYYWRAGIFNWICGVNMPITRQLEELKESNSNFNFEYPEHNFQIKLDFDDFNLSEFAFPELNYSLKTKNTDELIKTKEPDFVTEDIRNIQDLFVARALCNKEALMRLGFNKIIKLLSPLNQVAKFESQKILFNEVQEIGEFKITNKENIYSVLYEFRKNGFPQVLDVYKGHVESVDNKIAYVKLTSMSPERVVRSELFNKDIIKLYNLEEDSEFEYTIYKPSIGGGSAYHIEPI
jgi:hypothetical protein